MQSNSDADLVHLARAGNRDAYGELIRRHQQAIWGLAYLLLSDPVEAEDMTQEAFLRAWLNLDLLSDPSKFAPWLRRIVFGVSIDWLRAFRPDLYRLPSAGAELELSLQPAHLTSALDRLQAIEMRQRIFDAVQRLPQRYRLPLTLFHLDGLSHSKVAAALGVSESTSRSLVTRARQKLHVLLEGCGGEILPTLEEVFTEQKKEALMLHITDGESVAGTLRESGVPGKVSVVGDLMYEGPAPSGLDPETWRETRAQFFAAPGGHGITLDEARAYLKSGDDTLAAALEHDEVVIWLDHRLSDQLILIRVLDWFSRQDLGKLKVSLICIAEYPGTAGFAGLLLEADQLASLADTRLPVTDVEYRTARAAWAAFTSPDPTQIVRFLETDTSALPFIAGALRRHLEQFPSLKNGLSRTENQALSVLRHGAPLWGPELFVAVQQQEEAVFMGDSSFYGLMAELAAAPHPLVQISETLENRLGNVTITDTGRQVLEGRADHVVLNGIDRWLGGAHLTREKVWRWDREAGRLVGDAA